MAEIYRQLEQLDPIPAEGPTFVYGKNVDTLKDGRIAIGMPGGIPPLGPDNRIPKVHASDFSEAIEQWIANGGGIRIADPLPSYADLPTNLTALDAGIAYPLDIDGRLYVWSGTSFPPSGEGLKYRGGDGGPGDPGDNAYELARKQGYVGSEEDWLASLAGKDGAGIEFAGECDTYALLPSGLGPDDAGKAYYVKADGKLYVWTGTSFPSNGEGAEFRGPMGLTGRSAYQSAVNNGFTGTEAEWLASLVGPPGPPPAAGVVINDTITTAEKTWSSEKIASEVGGRIPALEKGAALGVAELGSDQKLKASQIPDYLLGGMRPQDPWNAALNLPAMPPASASNKGWYHIVQVAGETVIDGVGEWQVGDWIVSTGVKWVKIDNTDAVVSVCGKTGAVELTWADIQGLGDLATKDAANAALGADATIAGLAIGYLDLPVAVMNSAYTFDAEARGRMLAKTTTTARTYTVTTGFADGSGRVSGAANLANSGNLTLSASGITMRNMSDGGTASSIVIPPWAYATIWSPLAGVLLVSVTRAP